MEFLEKPSKNTFILHLYVKPNSRKQEIIHDSELLTIFVRSKAIQNRANKELITLLKNKLKIPSDHIQIISGLKSPRKMVRISNLEKMSKTELIKKLFQ